MSERSIKYQRQITGRSDDLVYDVGGYEFDGWTGSKLLEAKGPGYARGVENGKFADWYGGKASLIKQARNQIKVAGNNPIEWHVAEKEAYDAIVDAFAEEGITGIKVFHTPPL